MTGMPAITNLLLTEREGRTGEHWPVARGRDSTYVRKWPRATIPQYSPSKLGR